ncbi:MAG: DUF3189 family protein [Thermoanaerobacteraceae bacterium]|nr:DUF3189 family protein [Thermoanaerobacteraceae bacterium]
MKIFYCCYGSAHSSVVAASIHLGLLPSNRVPTSKEFLVLPHYDKTESFEIGTPFFMGKDEYDSDVFILGMASERRLIKKAILSFLAHAGLNTHDIMMVDTLRSVSFLTKLGGFISRRLGLIAIGRPLTILGIQQKYPDFVKLVAAVKIRSRIN